MLFNPEYSAKNILNLGGVLFPYGKVLLREFAFLFFKLSKFSVSEQIIIVCGDFEALIALASQIPSRVMQLH